MSDRVAQARPGAEVASPAPLGLAKHAARKTWPYALGLFAVLAVLGSVFRQSLNWGDVATWVVAITTLLAFLAAAFAGLVAYNLLQVETARDQQATQEVPSSRHEAAFQPSFPALDLYVAGYCWLSYSAQCRQAFGEGWDRGPRSPSLPAGVQVPRSSTAPPGSISVG